MQVAVTLLSPPRRFAGGDATPGPDLSVSPKKMNHGCAPHPHNRPPFLLRGDATPGRDPSVSPKKMNHGCAPTPHTQLQSLPRDVSACRHVPGETLRWGATLLPALRGRAQVRGQGGPPTTPSPPIGRGGRFLCGARQVFRRVGVANRIEARGAPPTCGRPLSQDPEVRMALRVGGVRSPVVISLATPERARCGRADGARGCWTGACGSRGRARQRGAAGDTRRRLPVHRARAETFQRHTAAAS